MAGEARFVCIEYPGVVQNDSKMLETLGSEKKLSKIYESKKPLELKWRPKDFYCKPVYGEKRSTKNLLMQVKRRKRNVKNNDGIVTEETDYQTCILGTVETTYSFRGIGDHQYLPMQKNSDGSYKSLVDKTTFKSLPETSYLQSTEVPLFMPPWVFSRFASKGTYLYNDKPTKRLPDDTLDESQANLAPGVLRKRRKAMNILVSFQQATPDGPLECATKELPALVLEAELDRVKKLFEERPMWLYTAVQVKCKLSRPRLKRIMPLVAYYFTSGPWKNSWARMGYDPRKFPEAKQYQTIDLRLKGMLYPGADQVIKQKRTPLRKDPRNLTGSLLGPPRTLQQTDLQKPVEEDLINEDEELKFVFKPDKLPPYRFMLYQLIDVDLDEVQKIVSQNNGKEKKCTEQDGWCVKGWTPKVRDILKDVVKTLLKEQGYEVTVHKPKKKNNPDDIDSNSDSDQSDSELTEMDQEMMDYIE